MSSPLREPRDYFVGTIEPVTSVSTTMTSALFATLPTYLSTSRYMPAEIVDENSGKHESIWIVGANGSSTAFVVRGVEGTDPQTWDQTSTIRCSPAVRDVLQTFSDSTSIPTDLHTGARYGLASDGVIYEWTQKQKGLPSMRSAFADCFGVTGKTDDNGYVPRMKSFTVGATTTSSQGLLYVYWDPSGPSGANIYRISTQPPTLTRVASVAFQGLLGNSDASWAGDCAIQAFSLIGATIKCFTATGAALANRQVYGSITVVGT